MRCARSGRILPADQPVRAEGAQPLRPACDHCYVYEHADQSWRGRPVAMPPATVAGRRAADRRARRRAPAAGRPAWSCTAVSRCSPGADRAARAAGRRCARRSPPVPRSTCGCRPTACCSTRSCADCSSSTTSGSACRWTATGPPTTGTAGPPTARSSHDQVRRGPGPAAPTRVPHLLRRAPLHGRRRATTRSGLRGAAGRAAARARPAAAARHLGPPAGPPGGPGSTPYADWLGAVHRRWVADGRPVPIRLFESLIRRGAAARSLTEAVGLDPADLLVVETDGTCEQADSLKTAYHGAAGDRVRRVQPLASTRSPRHPGIAARQAGVAGALRDLPGLPGGRGVRRRPVRAPLPAGTGFDNPSVYCADLLRLIDTVDATRRPPGPRRRPSLRSDRLAAPTVLDDLATGHGSPSDRALTRRRPARPSPGRCGGPAGTRSGTRGRLGAARRPRRCRRRRRSDAVLEHPFVRPGLVHAPRLVGPARPRAAPTRCRPSPSPRRCGPASPADVARAGAGRRDHVPDARQPGAASAWGRAPR